MNKMKLIYAKSVNICIPEFNAFCSTKVAAVYGCPIEKQSSEVFCKKGVLRNVTKFTGKQLRQSLFFNKVAGLFSINLQGCNFIKKEALAQVYFPVNFANFLRTLFLTEHLWWLLLTFEH